jgi:hypothetical protein
MTAKHEFLYYFHLVPADDLQDLVSAASRGEIHDFPTVAIPVDLFDYILDTLEWIPTRFGRLARFPFERAAIASEGASIARCVFAAWKQLFSAAGQEISLSLPGPHKVVFCKDEIVLAMASLEQFAETLERGGKMIYCSDVPDYRKRAINASTSAASAVA